jgi:hypothetical protein
MSAERTNAPTIDHSTAPAVQALSSLFWAQTPWIRYTSRKLGAHTSSPKCFVLSGWSPCLPALLAGKESTAWQKLHR